MTRLIGYARVSTQDQELNLQLDALKQIGCVKVFTDKTSGAKAERPGLDECLKYLQEGDVLIVWRLDRLGRSIKHLILLIEQLKQRNIAFKSICEGAIDTTTASGELIFNLFSVLAQFERRLLQDRTNAGLAAARARGRLGGKPPMSSADSRVLNAKKMYQDHNMSIRDICKILKISRTSFYRYINLKNEISIKG